MKTEDNFKNNKMKTEDNFKKNMMKTEEYSRLLPFFH